MQTVGIFYQREGIPDIEHIEIELTRTVGELRAAISAKHGGDPGDLVFVEDVEDPVGDDALITSITGPRGAKIHVHRCRRVGVTVHFAGKTLERGFAPGATIGRIKRWAAQELRMTEEDASEHVLQITGTTERSRPNTHVGTLAKCPKCSVSFDLVPEQRVNGGYL
jgi:hypothetical protein